MQSEAELREDIARVGKSLHERGYTHGSTGNLSVRTRDGLLLTPTGSSLGRLDPARLSKLDESGQCLSGDKPSKEVPLHLAVYQQRPQAQAVVHLHSTYSVALSLLADVNPDDALPPLTPYLVMRVGTVPILPYAMPGTEALAEAVARASAKHHVLVLAHHGSVVAASSLTEACDAAEELEEAAKLYLLLRGERSRLLSPDQCAELRRRYPC